MFPAPSSRLPIPFCSNLRQDPARGRRRWRTAAAPILCLSITVPLRCLGSRAMLTVSGPGHNIVISDNSPETTSHLLPQLHSHYIYNSSSTRHTLSVILNRSGPQYSHQHNIYYTTCLLYLSLLGCWVYICFALYTLLYLTFHIQLSISSFLYLVCIFSFLYL